MTDFILESAEQLKDAIDEAVKDSNYSQAQLVYVHSLMERRVKLERQQAVKEFAEKLVVEVFKGYKPIELAASGLIISNMQLESAIKKLLKDNEGDND